MSDRETALRGVFDAHYSAVLAYALRRTSPDEAHDVVSETFLVVWRRLEDAPAGAELAWLYGVARRQLANRRRGAQRQQRLAERLASQPVATGAAGEDPRTDDLLAALGTLGPGDQEVVRLCFWEELDNAQLAEAVGCSTGAARVRRHRALKRLEKALRTLPT